MANPLYSAQQLRDIEVAAAGGLMEKAGQAATRLAKRLLESTAPGSAVLVLAGPGNNGGDAFEVAARMAQDGWSVTVMQIGDTARYASEAQSALQKALKTRIVFVQADALPPRTWALVIDGLFGIGLQRPIEGQLRKVIEFVNTLSCPVLALDVPSGLDAERGIVLGPNGIAVHASHTITFIADKAGLHTADGRDYAGQVEVAQLDINPAHFPAASTWLADPDLFRAALLPRRQNSHKGQFGDVAVMGGATGMAGAAILAARTAVFCGAGRVYVGFIGEAQAFDNLHPELMCRMVQQLDLRHAVVVAGPGMGDSAAARMSLQTALRELAPLVLDADALNLIAADSALQGMLTRRSSPTLLTPHPVEAARLLGTGAPEIQADRLSAARKLANRYRCTVVLKGSGSVIARADGYCVINTTGNPALATGGTGDVLAGACGALLAQGLPVWEAALAAVWIHGQAADDLVAQGIGPVGLSAGELIPAMRAVLNRLIRQRS